MMMTKKLGGYGTSILSNWRLEHAPLRHHGLPIECAKFIISQFHARYETCHTICTAVLRKRLFPLRLPFCMELYVTASVHYASELGAAIERLVFHSHVFDLKWVEKWHEIYAFTKD